MPINQLVATVTIILQLKAGSVVGSATGFFYTRNNDLFLVTNQHVLYNETEKVFPEALRLRLHTDPNHITKNAEIEIPLYQDGKQVWKVHGKEPQADVALVKLDKNDLQKRFFIRAWSKQSFLPERYPLDPGEDIFIMGYPLSFHDVKHNLPVFRNAMIASSYRTPFQGLPLFLTDANLHPGTSGSPVITKPKNTWVDDKGNTEIVTGTVYYLLGVHSGTIDPKITGGQQIGLGAAWYIELVEEIAAQF
jgi:S1-C subfamily serine protease